MNTSKAAQDVADNLGPSAKAILLDKSVSPAAGLSFCRGSEELERLGLCDVDGQLSDMGLQVRDRLRWLAQLPEA